MASLSISETQFAFTYFHKFSMLQKKTWYEFVFPSLKAEGNPKSNYGGADVVIAKNLFIQFKVPDILKTVGTKEFYEYNAMDLFEAPFFRIKIKNSSLKNKKNSGQFEMLRRVAISGKSAQYIFPIFNTTLEKDDSNDKNYWFKSFYTMSPKDSLNSYCLSVDFNNMTGKEFNLDNSNKHTLCTDYKRGMGKGEVYIFSEAKYVQCKKFNSAFSLADELELIEEEEERSIEQTVFEIKEIFKPNEEQDGDNTGSNRNIYASINTIEELQFYILSLYDIFWIPILKNRLTKKTAEFYY